MVKFRFFRQEFVNPGMNRDHMVAYLTSAPSNGNATLDKIATPRTNASPPANKITALEVAMVDARVGTEYDADVSENESDVKAPKGTANPDGQGSIVALRRKPSRFPFFRLSPEIRNQIYGYVLAMGVPGEPEQVKGTERFTRTLEMPAIAQIDSRFGQEALGLYCEGRKFSVQVPQDPKMVDDLNELQISLMNCRQYTTQAQLYLVLRRMSAHSIKIETECDSYLHKLTLLNHPPSEFIENVIVTYNGRFDINCGGTNGWEPHSFLVGFKCHTKAGFDEFKGDRELKGHSQYKRMHVSWKRGFDAVRYEFVAILRQSIAHFKKVAYTDILLHPVVQVLVMHLCMISAGRTEPFYWVEVIANYYEYSAFDRYGLPDGEDPVGLDPRHDDAFSAYLEKLRETGETSGDVSDA
ncbi:hypothetical protein Daus18300_013842 [Diaporthe australafricana]|uniref:Uncharacterized protein n=1 Tax=Diaporthe australafricana TaxID=127596 RepID=A0ABR3VXJ4_9PEZI